MICAMPHVQVAPVGVWMQKIPELDSERGTLLRPSNSPVGQLAEQPSQVAPAAGCTTREMNEHHSRRH